MKIIQSFWSKPFQKSGGWYDPVFHYISWTLSCLKLLQFYDEVELVTDRKGYDILINKLHLPYTSVQVCLNDIDHYYEGLWALGKIYTYSLQNKPFIHVDNDIFIWEKFPDRIESSQLIAQHFENNYSYNRKSFFDLIKRGIKYDDFMKPEKSSVINESNLGIVGGCNMEFFKDYTEKVFRFVNINYDVISRLSKKDVSIVNNIFEQYIYYSLAKNKSCPIEYLLDGVSDSFKELVRFNSVPHSCKFVHVIGYHKQNSMLCYMMGQRLYYEYPEYYDRIVKYLNTI